MNSVGKRYAGSILVPTAHRPYSRIRDSSDLAVSLPCRASIPDQPADCVRSKRWSQRVRSFAVPTLLAGVGGLTKVSRPVRFARDETMAVLTALESLPRAREA